MSTASAQPSATSSSRARSPAGGFRKGCELLPVASPTAQDK